MKNRTMPTDYKIHFIISMLISLLNIFIHSWDFFLHWKFVKVVRIKKVFTSSRLFTMRIFHFISKQKKSFFEQKKKLNSQQNKHNKLHHLQTNCWRSSLESYVFP
jgi:hypothetical protein